MGSKMQNKLLDIPKLKLEKAGKENPNGVRVTGLNQFFSKSGSLYVLAGGGIQTESAEELTRLGIDPMSIPSINIEDIEL